MIVINLTIRANQKDEKAFNQIVTQRIHSDIARTLELAGIDGEYDVLIIRAPKLDHK